MYLNILISMLYKAPKKDTCFKIECNYNHQPMYEARCVHIQVQSWDVAKHSVDIELKRSACIELKNSKFHTQKSMFICWVPAIYPALL